MAIRILGTGSFLPEKSVTNDELAQVMDTSDEWISSRTGIRSRHISVGDTTASMAVKAAKKALEDGGVKPEELDHIFVATVSGDHATPSTSCEVQSALGAKNAVCMDVNAACSGFLYGMHIAEAFIRSGIYRNALVIGSETMSKIIDWTDRSTCVLFGDGAGAAVLAGTEEPGILSQIVGSNGGKWEVLECQGRPNENPLNKEERKPGYLTMNGQEVFKFAVKTVPVCVEEALEKAGVAADEVKYFLLHQANKRIIQSVAKRLGQPEEKFPMNLDQCGNTSAASLPILLAQMDEQGLLQRGDKLVLSGFGAGLTWGACLLEW